MQPTHPGRFRRGLVATLCGALAATGAFALAQWWAADGSAGGSAADRAVERARDYAARTSARMQLADRSLRALAADLREPGREGVIAGATTQRYFEALARVDGSGRIEALQGALAGVPALNRLNLEDLSRGDSVIVTVARDAQRPRIMLIRRLANRDRPAELLVAGIAPQFLWEHPAADNPAAELCVRDEANRVLFCSGPRIEPAIDKLPRLALAEQSGTVRWTFLAGTWMAGYARLDLPVSAFSGIWTVIAVEPPAATQGLSRALQGPAVALMAALACGLLAAWAAARRMRPRGIGADAAAGVPPGPAMRRAPVPQPDSLDRQRRTINAMADIDRAILSGADAQHLVALAVRLMLECVGCDVVMLALRDRDLSGRVSVLVGAAGGQAPQVIDDTTLPASTAALLDGHPEGIWSDRLAELPFLAPLLERGALTALLLPLHEDGRAAGLVALGVARREVLGADACAHARALVVRLGVALTAADRARALYAHTHFDATTGLPNRRYLREHLGPQIARTRRDDQRLALLFIDLDGFKQVNATAGHDRGDQILTEAAARLRACLREEDILARFGGDEFVVVLPRIADGLDARKVADKLLAALAESYAVAGADFRLGASIGISLFPDDAQSFDELLRHADFAMFRAKAAGRGQYAFFNEGVNRTAAARNLLESDLRRATEQREFVVYYQPQIDMASGRIEGAEALVRWLHPQRGMVAPGEFIPVAEQSSLILQIGEQVMRAACAQYRLWESAGIAPRRISINVAGLELKRPDFADRVEAILGEYGLRPFCLELEITESSLLENSTLILSQLERLRKRGMRIAFDDFGTGYSSLAYLKRLPVDVVKIDQSFVRDIGVDPDSAAIARAIIDMAHHLGKTTVAEGIETEQQRALLYELGCEIGQGYLWSRPLPVDAFERLCRQWNARPHAATPLRLVSA